MTDDAEARATAHALIQGYLGPDHKVTICRLSIWLSFRHSGTRKSEGTDRVRRSRSILGAVSLNPRGVSSAA